MQDIRNIANLWNDTQNELHLIITYDDIHPALQLRVMSTEQEKLAKIAELQRASSSHQSMTLQPGEQVVFSYTNGWEYRVR